MTNLLITGGSGYIGRNLAHYYIQKEYSVRLILKDPNKADPELQASCEILPGDITEPDSMAGAFDNIDAVIHAAGQLGQFGLPYKELYAVNVTGAVNVLEAAMKAGVNRYIHLSAGGVTGPLKQSFVDESYSPSPVTDYEKTKWIAEQQVKELGTQANYNSLVLRPTFTYGPGDPHKLKLFKAINKGHYFYVGNGLSTVHPVYIDDLIKGIDAALHSDIRDESIVIGGVTAVTKRELSTEIASALNVNPPRLMMPANLCKVAAAGCEFFARLSGSQPWLTKSQVLALSENWGYSIDKAKRLLHYSPTTILHDGIAKTVTWYRQQGWL